MKQLLIIIAAFAFMLPLHSQGSESYTDKKNEINIGFFNAFELNNYSDFGIGYKRMVKNGAWRTGTGIHFYREDGNRHDNVYDDETTAIRSYTISPRIGYEFHQHFNRLQLQYGIDFVTSFHKRTVENLTENEDYNTFQQTNKNKISIRPFLGLKVYITEYISISTETYLDIGYSIETFENNSLNNNYTRNAKAASVALGPLGVFSINFHF